METERHCRIRRGFAASTAVEFPTAGPGKHCWRWLESCAERWTSQQLYNFHQGKVFKVMVSDTAANVGLNVRRSDIIISALNPIWKTSELRIFSRPLLHAVIPFDYI
jgi:hypothetical protein